MDEARKGVIMKIAASKGSLPRSERFQSSLELLRSNNIPTAVIRATRNVTACPRVQRGKKGDASDSVNSAAKAVDQQRLAP